MPPLELLFFGFLFLLVWGTCFTIAIKRDLAARDASRVDNKALSRLFITDLWTITVALVPPLWLLSFVIKEPIRHGDKLAEYLAVAILAASELLGMFGALIRLASRYGKYPPTRVDRALWLISGAFNGFVLLIACGFLLTCFPLTLLVCIAYGFHRIYRK